MKYDHARVSTDGRSVEAQVGALIKAGCKEVFREVASGAKADRSRPRPVLDQFDARDILMVTRLARAARSIHDLLNIRQHDFAAVEMRKGDTSRRKKAVAPQATNATPSIKRRLQLQL